MPPVVTGAVLALIAVLMGFSPKFGALIQAIALPVMGGIGTATFGAILLYALLDRRK